MSEDCTSSIDGVSEVGPKRKSETWSDYWNRFSHCVSGLTGERFFRKQEVLRLKTHFKDQVFWLAQMVSDRLAALEQGWGDQLNSSLRAADRLVPVTLAPGGGLIASLTELGFEDAANDDDDDRPARDVA